MTYQWEDSGKMVDHQVGDLFEILLDENPTTGYRWQFEKNGTGVLAIVQDDFVREGEGRVGAAGMRRFTVRVERPGAGELVARYARGAEIQSGNRVFVLSVRVSASD